MAVIYFDSSALLKLVLTEDGSTDANRLFDVSDLSASSPVAYSEVRAGLAAALRSKRLTSAEARQAARYWQDDWGMVRRVPLTPVVEQLAGELAEEHALRGADAIHLASAFAVGPTVIMATWDRQLSRAASASGLAVAPGNLS